ncbi:MAG: hypothetical protein L0Z62_32660 [Gemmataceae bacterium]|nr:hypothetical protein [Gemmataceae bacterium]
MSELLEKFNGLELLGLITLLLGFLVGGIIAVTAIVTAHLRETRQTHQETVLKQEMLQRGMSAEEIVQVITASRSGSSDAASPKPAHTAAHQGEPA